MNYSSNGFITDRLLSLIPVLLFFLSRSQVANAQDVPVLITSTQAIYIVSAIGIFYIIVFTVIFIITCYAINVFSCCKRRGRVCPSSEGKMKKRKDYEDIELPLTPQSKDRPNEFNEVLQIKNFNEPDDGFTDDRRENPAYKNSSEDSSSTESESKNKPNDDNLVLANLSARNDDNYFDDLEEDNSVTMI